MIHPYSENIEFPYGSMSCEFCSKSLEFLEMVKNKNYPNPLPKDGWVLEEITKTNSDATIKFFYLSHCKDSCREKNRAEKEMKILGAK